MKKNIKIRINTVTTATLHLPMIIPITIITGT